MINHSEKVPSALSGVYQTITALTDAFAAHHLDAEYAQLIRYATAALSRKRPSPLSSGQPELWAAGITHAIGMLNFLFDSAQTPHLSAAELYAAFGVKQSSALAKSKKTRDLLKMTQFDPAWTRPSRLGDHPLAWMVSIDGLILDARHLTRDLQVQCHALGLIPYVPADGPP